MGGVVRQLADTLKVSGPIFITALALVAEL
jgi:hypothetical protein